MLKKIYTFMNRVENVILIITFVIMILSTFAQTINRNFIGLSISWFEELARYSMVYMTLFATELGLRDGSQISITLLTDITKGNIKKIILIITKIFIIIFSGVIFISSFDIQKVQLLSNQISPGLKVPMFIPYFALTLNFGIILITQFVLLIGTLIYGSNKKEN